MSVCSSEASDINLTDHEKILIEFKKSIDWPLKTHWPGLVGDCLERAKAIIEFGSPYYVVTKPYDKLKVFEASIVDCLRVIVYLDKDNYVAVAPKVG
jgi:hypothetical protein